MARKDLKDFHIHPLAPTPTANPLPSYAAGMPPYVRGPHAIMYLKKPWAIRQQPHFKNLNEEHAFFKAMAQRQTSTSVINVALNDLITETLTPWQNLQQLFKDLSLSNYSVLWSGAFAPVVALAAHHSLVDAQNQAIAHCPISVQHNFWDNLKHYSAPDFEQLTHHFWRQVLNTPKFRGLSLSGAPLHTALPEVEIAFTLAAGLAYIDQGIKTGLKIDALTAHLNFTWTMDGGLADNIAKVQAARYLWAAAIKQYHPKHQKSMAMRSHAITAHSLTELPILAHQEALAAILGGTQSLTITSADAQLARKTQLVLQKEIELTAPIDPLGGSQVISQKTHTFIVKAEEILSKIQKIGGLWTAKDQGHLASWIEELSASPPLSKTQTSDRSAPSSSSEVFDKAKNRLLSGDNLTDIEEFLS